MKTLRIGLLSLVCASACAGATESDGAARKVLAQLVAHDFAAVYANMTPTLKAAVTNAQMLATAWQQVTGPVGDFQRVTSVESMTAPNGLHATTLHCAFTRGPLDVRLAFDAQGQLAGLFFPPPTAPAASWSPPSYAAPERFDERDVTVGAAPFVLKGKLTLPRGAGPFPAVVLVHGSGPQDENEQVGPNAPFHDLAVGLASRGIAVLRYQKRTFVYHQAEPNFTVRQETIDDAQAAVALLAKTDKIDRKRIFVLGHSLGGMLAPRIADHDPLVAGLIIAAGTTRPLEEIVLEQVKARGTPDDIKAAQASLERIRDPKLKPSDIVDFVGAKVPGSYFLDLRHYSPAQLAAQLDVPILVLQGDRDIQVRAADFAGWQRTLGARPHAQLKRYPTLTHLFTAGEGTLADYEKPAHVAPEVIADIAAFVDKGRTQ